MEHRIVKSAVLRSEFKPPNTGNTHPLTQPISVYNRNVPTVRGCQLSGEEYVTNAMRARTLNPRKRERERK